jgi:hypothetical protein
MSTDTKADNRTAEEGSFFSTMLTQSVSRDDRETSTLRLGAFLLRF